MQTDPGALFRRWLIAAIQHRRLTHAELARRSGIDRSTVTRILNEERGVTLDTAVRILDALDDGATPPELHRLGLVAARTQWVRALLADDPLLDAEDVDALMHQYARRRGRTDDRQP